MIDIYPESTIYVACPGNLATGGTELCHQLVLKLRQCGLPGKIFYSYFTDKNNPMPDQFKMYNVEYTTDLAGLDDTEKNLLITPEISTELVFRFKKIRTAIWWLSVDNYCADVYGKYWRLKWKLKLRFRGSKFNIEHPPKKPIYHLYQSEYARQFLLKYGIQGDKMYCLSDYLNPVFIQNDSDCFYGSKGNVILYNPRKGFGFTNKIIKYALAFNWIPLENKTPEEIALLFRKAKLYIDFGEHPGRDRIPREAAVNHCVVLTSKSGSASYFEDVPIPNKYKFDAKVKNIPLIVDFISEVLENYDNHIDDFRFYRDVIKRQEADFESSIRKIFAKNL